MTVLSWLTTTNDLSLDVIPFISGCRNLMAHMWTVQLLHIYREDNGCVDALAKRGHQLQCLLEVYDTCSSFVYAPFVWDMQHFGTSRLCPLEVFGHLVL